MLKIYENLSEWEVDEIYLIDIDSTQKKTQILS